MSKIGQSHFKFDFFLAINTFLYNLILILKMIKKESIFLRLKAQII